jgi:hypothetical protein
VPGSRGSTNNEALPSGSWVELQLTVLKAADRPDNLPPETRRHDYVARVRGFLTGPATLGTTATVRTRAGREVRGTLTSALPRNPADFGDPVPELLAAGDAHRARFELER